MLAEGDAWRAAVQAAAYARQTAGHPVQKEFLAVQREAQNHAAFKAGAALHELIRRYHTAGDAERATLCAAYAAAFPGDHAPGRIAAYLTPR